jgi:hypothetical protein
MPQNGENYRRNDAPKLPRTMLNTIAILIKSLASKENEANKMSTITESDFQQECRVVKHIRKGRNQHIEEAQLEHTASPSNMIKTSS